MIDFDNALYQETAEEAPHNYDLVLAMGGAAESLGLLDEMCARMAADGYNRDAADAASFAGFIRFTCGDYDAYDPDAMSRAYHLMYEFGLAYDPERSTYYHDLWALADAIRRARDAQVKGPDLTDDWLDHLLLLSWGAFGTMGVKPDQVWERMRQYGHEHWSAI